MKSKLIWVTQESLPVLLIPMSPYQALSHLVPHGQQIFEYAYLSEQQQIFPTVASSIVHAHSAYYVTMSLILNYLYNCNSKSVCILLGVSCMTLKMVAL